MNKKKDLDQVKIEILARLDIRTEFESFGVQCVGNPNHTGWLACRNPYKKDQHPSASINIGSGSHRGYLVAFNSNGNAGKPYAAWSFFDVAMDFLPGAGGDFRFVLRHYAETTGVQFQKEEDSPPTAELVKKFRDNLAPEIIEYLHTKRGLNDASIVKYEIGWSSSKSKTDGRNTFPVYNRKGLLVNIRRHNSKAKPKTLNWPGHGEARLWGVDRLAKAAPGSIVGITEGEFDSMLVEQETGLTSVSPTNGCNAFQRAWVQEFHGKHVVLLWDCDEEGRAAVEKIILPAFRQAVASGEVLSIKVVWLFSKLDKKQKDFTDFIVKAGGTGAQALKMVEAAPPHGYIITNGAEPLPDPDIFFDGKRFILTEMVDFILETGNYFHDGTTFYRYNEAKGVWEACHDNIILNRMVALLGTRLKRQYVIDALRVLEMKTYRPPEALHQNFYLINMQNGMLDLNAGKLIPHDKKYLSRIQIPIEYNPSAECPKFLKVMNEMFPEDFEKVNALQEFTGYCFYPKIFIDKCLFLIGEGGNGKSVFLYLLQHILGEDNISSLDPQMFSDKFMLGTLKNKLLNVSSEIEAREQIAANIFKKVISGDLIQADTKYSKSQTMFYPIAKHVFSMNKVPLITDRSYGFSRRLLVVQFTQRFEGAFDNKNLKYELAENELPGILNWALYGLDRVLAKKEISESFLMKKSRDIILQQINPMLTFVEEDCDLDERSMIRKTELYRKYFDWCKESGIRPLGKLKFYDQLVSDYPQITEKKINGPWFFLGINEKVIK